MGQLQNAEHRGGYLPWLEGIRGYGFLLVFCGHYFLPFQLARLGTFKYGFIISFSALALCAVPAFFVLSGYLIGGILFDTRNREGFFRVFYFRRILRVFPVFYLTLLAILAFYKLHGLVPNYRFWAHFLYIQNLLPGYVSAPQGPVSMIHFWSLAVEEQFYLLWPLVVWFFPERSKLIKIAAGIVVCCCLFRGLAPLLTSGAHQFSASTPSRVDAILLGVILALIRDTAAYRRFQHLGKWVLLGSAGTAIILANWKGWGWAATFWGQEIVIPLTHVVGLSLVVAVLESGSLLQRACSARWACWLGGISYSAYVIHLTFAPYFLSVLPEKFGRYMRPHFAIAMSAVLAFCLTLLLSVLCKICIEEPLMRLKRRVQYSDKRSRKSRAEIGERVLVNTGA